MSVQLPNGPYRILAQVDDISFSSDLESPLGGATQRLNRLGDRFALSFGLPTVRVGACGALWATRLSQAKRQGAIMALPASVLKFGQTGSVGTPRVNGAGQAGMTLNADGFNNGALLVEGQYFSFKVNGVNYLHRLTADKAASVVGQVALNIEPMLRVQIPDNTELNFAAPEIEGLIALDTRGLAANRWGLGSFETITITENR
ncbi:hypothetical protein [Asticcacaulis excentricus]|uniref:Uncharacterized protein n=1 Tax=Asticcacaulis excentricus (strain ATCC 15261 / DSM 4724 / KCTC 12464 / NCIMB 9791 / VKM B-1370 / CB 48) TaxID=573065 RepID=E8RPR3_ASTEC|nr:hypothetical protein [Asticcacaulis excentricus]ADU12040.1 hypothetical protein Astex_0342 [Asticcacaulis excentricus CB 48]